MDTNIDASAIIEALGGTSAVAEMCDIKPPSVSEWKARNIIPKARLKYLRLARPDVFDGLPVAQYAEAANADAAMPEGSQSQLSRRRPQTASGLGARPGSQTCAVGSTVAGGLTDEPAADGATRTVEPADD